MDYQTTRNDSRGGKELHSKIIHHNGVTLPISIREKRNQSNTSEIPTQNLIFNQVTNKV